MVFLIGHEVISEIFLFINRLFQPLQYILVLLDILVTTCKSKVINIHLQTIKNIINYLKYEEYIFNFEIGLKTGVNK